MIILLGLRLSSKIILVFLSLSKFNEMNINSRGGYNSSALSYQNNMMSNNTHNMNYNNNINAVSALGLNNIQIENNQNKLKENTEILSVNMKINPETTLVFKIRKYDDMFKTVKIFCEINKLENRYIKPIILYIIKALNSIYGMYNLKLHDNEVKELNRIKINICCRKKCLKRRNKR